MRKRVLLAVAGAMVAAGLAIAGAAAPSAPSASVSTALDNYLATGILPTDVTGDPGVWNYAGPTSACPGPGWNCVTLGVLPITQVGTVNVIQSVGGSSAGSSQTGYANTYECNEITTDPTPADDSQVCLITQGGPGSHNTAKCVLKKKPQPTPPSTATFFRQRCSITQSGQDNQATIVQVIDQTGGTTQGAVQEAGVSQTATASKNQLQVDQEIKQYTETGDAQHQDAYQVVTGPYTGPDAPPTGPAALQTAAGAGDSAAQINQKQNQRAKGGTTQTQNDGVNTFTPPADCHTALPPVNPHLCSNLDQTSGGGKNQSQLSQTWDAEATTTALLADQRQGSAPLTGGWDGRVHQVTAAPGFSQGDADQKEILRLFAPPGSNPNQVQFGGGGCCGFGSQIGPGTEWLDQEKDMRAVGGTEQTATLLGILSSPDGSCGINHDVQTNSDQAQPSESAEPCVLLVVETTCANAEPNGDEEVGACQESVVTACAPGDEPSVDVEGTDVTVSCDDFDPDLT